MTLAEFQELTAGMSPDTEIKLIDPLGNVADATILTIEDLAPEDTWRDLLDPTAITIAPEAC